MHTQVHALGQKLAQQSIRVLATALLPGAVRITEVHTHARGRSQSVVVAVAAAAYRRFTAGLGQTLAVPNGHVLHPPRSE